MKWLDLIDGINVLARVEAIVWGLTSGRARSKKHPKAKKKHGAREIRITRDADYTGTDAVDLLKRYGIRAGAGRTRSHEFVFYVPAEQYTWALSILKGRGIEITAGDQVKAKATKPKRSWQGGEIPAIPTPPAPTTKPKGKP